MINEIKGEVEEMKKEISEIEEGEKSFFLQLLEALKTSNKRLFVICIILIAAILALFGYIIYLHNDIGTVEETYTQRIEEVNAIDNSTILNGGN